MELNNDLFERGIAMMGAVMGEDWIKAARKRHDAAVAAGDAERNDFSTQVLFGFMFNRPQLSLRDRSIIMLTTDIVQGTPLALVSHLAVAVHAGLTRDEIEEIVFQLTQYCGFGRAREGSVVIQKFFADLDAAKKETK
jgi:4-carboxymuconolactone decarboxylase